MDGPEDTYLSISNSTPFYQIHTIDDDSALKINIDFFESTGKLFWSILSQSKHCTSYVLLFGHLLPFIARFQIQNILYFGIVAILCHNAKCNCDSWT